MLNVRYMNYPNDGPELHKQCSNMIKFPLAIAIHQITSIVCFAFFLMPARHVAANFGNEGAGVHQQQTYEIHHTGDLQPLNIWSFSIISLYVTI